MESIDQKVAEISTRRAYSAEKAERLRTFLKRKPETRTYWASTEYIAERFEESDYWRASNMTRKWWRPHHMFRAPRIKKAPGYALGRLAEAIYSKKTYTTVFVPLLSDMEMDYFEALAEKRWLKGRWVAMRGRFSFWAAVAVRIPISISKLVFELWKFST